MHNGNLYVGVRDGIQTVVTVNGERLETRRDLLLLSSSLDWAYAGASAAQLSLAILAFDLTDTQALYHHQTFKWDVVAKLPRPGWTLTGKIIHQWLLSQVYDFPMMTSAQNDSDAIDSDESTS